MAWRLGLGRAEHKGKGGPPDGRDGVMGLCAVLKAGVTTSTDTVVIILVMCVGCRAPAWWRRCTRWCL